MVSLSGIPRPSRTTQSPSPSVTPKPNENTDLVAMAVRKARARSGRITTRILMMLLPRHEKRRAASRNTKTAILIANQSENDENLKSATTTVTKTRRETGRRNGRSGPGQGRRNQRAESNLKTSPPPLRPNPIDPPGVNGPEVLPNQNRSQTPRNPRNDHPPPHHSRNMIMRAWEPLTFTERSDQNARSRGGLRHLARPVPVSSFVMTVDPSMRRTVCIMGSGRTPRRLRQNDSRRQWSKDPVRSHFCTS